MRLLPATVVPESDDGLDGEELKDNELAVKETRDKEPCGEEPGDKELGNTEMELDEEVDPYKFPLV